MLRKLFSQTAIYGVSAILSKFINYLLTPYLTRILGTETYGEVSLYYALIPFANVVLTMGLATGYFRFAAKCTSEQEKKQLFSTVWAAVSMLSIVFFLIFALFSDTLNQLLQYPDIRWYMVATGALIMVDNINQMPFANLRQQGNAKYYTIVNVTNVLVNLGLCVALYTFIPGAKTQSGWVIVANLVASCVSFVMLLPSASKMFVWKLSKNVLRTITIYSLPLMIGGVMGVASDFIDRQMLNWLLPADISKSQVGIFSAVSKIAALMVIFRQIYTLGAEPFFLQNFSKNEFRRVNSEALKYFIIAGLAIFIGITLFDDLFARIIGENFREGMVVVPILLMANLFTGIVVTLSFWYKQVNKTHMAIYVMVTGLVLTIGLNYWLIPTYGYLGAAWTHLWANLAMVIISFALGQKYYKIPYDLKRISLYFIVALAIYTLSECISSLSVIVQYCVKILLILSYVLLVLKLEWKK